MLEFEVVAHERTALVGGRELESAVVVVAACRLKYVERHVVKLFDDACPRLVAHPCGVGDKFLVRVYNVLRELRETTLGVRAKALVHKVVGKNDRKCVQTVARLVGKCLGIGNGIAFHFDVLIQGGGIAIWACFVEYLESCHLLDNVEVLVRPHSVERLYPANRRAIAG